MLYAKIRKIIGCVTRLRVELYKCQTDAEIHAVLTFAHRSDGL